MIAVVGSCRFSRGFDAPIVLEPTLYRASAKGGECLDRVHDRRDAVADTELWHCDALASAVIADCTADDDLARCDIDMLLCQRNIFEDEVGITQAVAEGILAAEMSGNRCARA